MTVLTRIILILMLMLPLADALSAQPTASTSTATAAGSAASAASEESRSSEEIRQDFSALLRRHPPELATILTLDPTLLSNDAFLTGYPELAHFVAQHSEVRRNPRFY